MKLPRKTQSTLSILFAVCAASVALAAPRLMQGPMVGTLEHNQAKVWARVAGEHSFSVRYSPSKNFQNARETEAIQATEENDYCVSVSLVDLEPGSFYYYQVLLDGQPLDSPREREGYPVLTAPAPGTDVKFSVAFGAGAKADSDGLQAIWLQVQNARPHAFFWVGENETVDGLAPEFQAEQYRKQRSVPFLQPLLRSIPQLSTWDAGSAANLDAKSLEVFSRYWANPGYGTKEAPGSYFTYSYGGVDFIFLDTLSYRSDSEGGALLGDAQLAWLENELSQSKARFKILLSGSSWTKSAKTDANAWDAHHGERDRLFHFIQSRAIEGVALLSGDNSQAEINAIPLSQVGGYDLYELASSPLAQEPTGEYVEEADSVITIHEPYAAAMNFGRLTFDMSQADPTLSFEIINVFGESVFPKFELKASELTNGIASWKTKVNADALAYLEASLTMAE